MKSYMITIIGSAVLASVTHLITPEKWSKYIKIITGIMIMSVIVSPILSLKKIDIFNDFTCRTSVDENIQKKMVIKETENKIAESIKNEIENTDKAEVKLSVNDRFEIEGVDEIRIWTKKEKSEVVSYLTKTYSPKNIYIQK